MIMMCDPKQERVPADWLSSAHSRDVWRRPRQLWISCTHPAMDVVLKRVCQQLPAMVLRQPRFTVPESEAGDALILWALEELGAEELVVCGHSCDGRNLPPRAPTTQDLRMRVRDRASASNAAREHLVQQVEALKSRPQVMAAIERGNLAVHGLFYMTESGVFTLYNERTRAFEIL